MMEMNNGDFSAPNHCQGLLLFHPMESLLPSTISSRDVWRIPKWLSVIHGPPSILSHAHPELCTLWKNGENAKHMISLWTHGLLF